MLLIIYVGYGYYSERSLRELMKSDTRLKEVKSEYVTNKSMLEQKKLQSGIAVYVKPFGLFESRGEPYKIMVDKSYFDKKD